MSHARRKLPGFPVADLRDACAESSFLGWVAAKKGRLMKTLSSKPTLSDLGAVVALRTDVIGLVVASHYDTNYPLRNTSYVGANDGASSSAMLLELANQLRGKTCDGHSVWLVWDDAEEAMKPDGSAGQPFEMPFGDDSLYGVKHLAEKWQADGTLTKIKAFLLADMIGGSDLNIDRDTNSTPWLENVVYEAAARLGYQSHFFARTVGMEDDHLPFLKRGVPSADLIDFDYGYNNVFWHTPQDTLDKLSPKSLEVAGSTILETIRLLNKMEPLPPK